MGFKTHKDQSTRLGDDDSNSSQILSSPISLIFPGAFWTDVSDYVVNYFEPNLSQILYHRSLHVTKSEKKILEMEGVNLLQWKLCKILHKVFALSALKG
jgi:hypothetical protein